MNLNKQDNRAREILIEWASKKGHDRCWYYPEFIKPLAEIYGLSLEGVVLTPSRAELFEQGCVRFRREQYHGKSNVDVGSSMAIRALSDWIDENKGREITYHDEILQILARILKVKCPSRPNVSEEELRKGCKRYELTLYNTR